MFKKLFGIFSSKEQVIWVKQDSDENLRKMISWIIHEIIDTKPELGISKSMYIQAHVTEIIKMLLEKNPDILHLSNKNPKLVQEAIIDTNAFKTSVLNLLQATQDPEYVEEQELKIYLEELRIVLIKSIRCGITSIEDIKDNCRFLLAVWWNTELKLIIGESILSAMPSDMYSKYHEELRSEFPQIFRS